MAECQALHVETFS